jgi:signal transduction histidine kinase/CheY-like chemotaxis protein
MTHRFEPLEIGGGEVGSLIRSMHWDATPLGPMGAWPQHLRIPVGMMLSSRFAMWMGWGPELTFLYNDAYARMTLGKKHPWALGKAAREVWAEIWRDLEPRVGTVFKTGTATWDEALPLILERSGYAEETYHTFSYSPLPDPDGGVAGMLCVVVEETDRVIGERKLAALRTLAAGLASTTTEPEVLNAVVQSLDTDAQDLPFTAVYLCDEDGSARLACTTRIERGTVLSPEVIKVGDADAPWPLGPITGGRVVIPIAERASELATAGSALSGPWDRPPRDAIVVPIAQRGQERAAGFLVAGANPYRQIDPSYEGFVELIGGQIASSLANARAYEAERRRAESLAELDRAKTVFFSNVSHELRTPITLLLGPAEDTLADPETTSVNRERASLIHRNAHRLLKLVNTLLDFSRIEAGRVEAVFEPTDLTAYTTELASSFRSAVERAGLELTIDAPTLDQPVFVDRDMWEKIVLNLVSNAFKHTFDGGIHVAVSSDRGGAVLTVSDTGVGIPTEQLSHVFERFRRVPNARSRTHEGTGIGLALVQELVRLHHGEVSVESRESVGTTFTVRVPLGTAHLPGDRVAAERTRASTAVAANAFVEEALRWLPSGEYDATDGTPAGIASHGAEDARVLIADDNADMRGYVARLLRERGWSVEEVGDGEAALARARRTPRPDVVLSDVMMPKLDGFALLEALRADANTRSIPVVLLSARAGEEARVEGLRAGADDYLVKPFAARELIARIETQLRRAQEQREQEEIIETVDRERGRLRDLFAGAPAAIAVLQGPAHVIEIANENWLEVAGRRDVIGRSLAEALPELEEQGIIAMADEVYRTGVAYIGTEFKLYFRANGTDAPAERYFNFVCQPLRDEESGRISSLFVHAVEVTDLVHSRRDAERAQRMAEEANRAKSEFLAAMSHELRTPLNAIAGHAQLLEMGVHGPLTDAQRLALGRIQLSEGHLLALINDVLNYAKLEAGRVQYQMSDVGLAELTKEVLSMIQPQLASGGLSCEVNVPDGLVAHADREKTRQILINLLSNAIKFTDRGGRITIAAVRDTTADDGTRDGQRPPVLLQVSDTGIGIPADKQESIFDPFVQVHRNLTRPTEGTGLGLAISRDLARGMGGELGVQSVVGQGSTFSLRLPAASTERVLAAVT